MERLNQHLEKLAQRLRQCQSMPEFQLWSSLCQADSRYQFRRQQPIDDYIVDLFCPELDLVIEIDGDTHDLKYGAEGRYQKLKALGLRVLRFSNNELKRDIRRVVRKIRKIIQEQAT